MRMPTFQQAIYLASAVLLRICSPRSRPPDACIMANFAHTIALAGRALINYARKRPLCVSFEVTHNCNARCRHCHLGPPRSEQLAPPERYAELCNEIRPIVAQVSGGEPLLRGDVDAIVRALTRRSPAPHMILTTNGALLTKKRHQELRQAGICDFSLSFDYPDARHDEFRNVPGLYTHIDDLMRALSSNGSPHAVTLACVIHRGNFRDLPAIAEKALAWKAGVSFSAYTWLRTGNREMLLSADEVGELRDVLRQVMAHKRRHGNVFTSDYVLRKIPEYFARPGMPRCRAGERILIVNPDGTLSPCGLIVRDYPNRAALVSDFTRKNSCDCCYTSSRANTEKPAYWLIRDTLSRL
jgi:AdoMet-dependent heme synthase